MSGIRFIGTLVLIPGLLFTAAFAGEPEKIDHRSLENYRDEQGTLKEIETLRDWKRRRADILANLQKVMGPLPEHQPDAPLSIEKLEEAETELYRRDTISFSSGDGDKVFADLYFPKTGEEEKRPGIVALHPTGAQGKRIVAGEGPRENRQYAVELAERGYVVIAPDYPSFGQLSEYDFAADDYVSGTMKGIVNHRRCVDLLRSLPSVDRERIGVIGHSLGGHNAMFLAAFDERVDVVVSSCGWTPFHDYYGGDVRGWTSDRYMPRIREVYELDPDRIPFDFAEIIGLIAPRPFLSCSPLHDSNFEVAGVRKGVKAARPIYQLYGYPERLKLLTPDCEHDFPPEVRAAAYHFLDAGLDFGQDET